MLFFKQKLILDEAVHAMQDLIELTESDRSFPHKEVINNLFMASIIQLNLVDLKGSHDPFDEVICEHQHLHLEAGSIFRYASIFSIL